MGLNKMAKARISSVMLRLNSENPTFSSRKFCQVSNVEILENFSSESSLVMLKQPRALGYEADEGNCVGEYLLVFVC